MKTDIRRNVRGILNELPHGVELVAAAKTRTAEEIREAVDAGVEIVGENYVQEALEAFGLIGEKVKWHFIGHLQKNKVKKAVEIFDMIETVDSESLAREIDKRSRGANKVMPVLIEINSGREARKYGVFPEKARELVIAMSGLKNIRVAGLMTMGPFSGDPERARPFFSETRRVFEELRREGVPGAEMKYLSMGMSNSYKVAISEGANMVRVGERIFGRREESRRRTCT